MPNSDVLHNSGRGVGVGVGIIHMEYNGSDAPVPPCTLTCSHHKIKRAMNSDLINSRLVIGMNFYFKEYVNIN